MKNILVFAPHPDDEILGCGGSLRLHTLQGAAITVIYLTSGGSGSLTASKGELMELREQEARSSCERLGIQQWQFWRNPDGYLEYNQGILCKITAVIRELRPDVIYLPHSEENHPDHRVTHALVREGSLRAAMPAFQECGAVPWATPWVLAYEIWTPLRCSQYSLDISDVLEDKLAALGCHASQLQLYEYADAIAGLNRYRGVLTGKGRFCECFQILSGQPDWQLPS